LLGTSIFFAATQMHFTLFPTIGADVITAKLKMPPGSSLQYTAWCVLLSVEVVP
jgi:multidrug efflux pump subunit AcrB